MVIRVYAASAQPQSVRPKRAYGTVSLRWSNLVSRVWHVDKNRQKIDLVTLFGTGHWILFARRRATSSAVSGTAANTNASWAQSYIPARRMSSRHWANKFFLYHCCRRLHVGRMYTLITILSIRPKAIRLNWHAYNLSPPNTLQWHQLSAASLRYSASATWQNYTLKTVQVTCLNLRHSAWTMLGPWTCQTNIQAHCLNTDRLRWLPVPFHVVIPTSTCIISWTS